jgi:glutamate 5-kinase
MTLLKVLKKSKKISMHTQRIVIKVGSHVLTQDGNICKVRMLALVELISTLKQNKYEVILVSSGAVAAGFTRLPLDRSTVANRQALAAIGQPLLLKMYQEKFAQFDLLCSQVLFSADVFDSLKHVKHAKVAIDTLLENNVVPIINENDTVSVEELVFGDNDRLSAHVAHHFEAELLVILSDIDAFYDKDPNVHLDAKRREVVTVLLKEELNADYTPNNEFATGGIVTKLQSADFLMKHNKNMFLASGFDLSDAKSFLLDNKHMGGTLFKPKQQ